jgi:hypothetical protein
MFFVKIKNFFVLKSINKSLNFIKHNTSNHTIKSVGILFDDSQIKDKKSFVNELVKNKISLNNITVLCYKSTIKKNEVFDVPVFCDKDLAFNGEFSNEKVNEFIATPFDLLINYYDVEKAALLKVSLLSKAQFKVGFASIDNRMNQFIIDTKVENDKTFIEELFKYLKILNKI